MTEHTANAMLYSYAEKQAAERAEWAKKLASSCSPAKPRVVKAQQKKINLFARIFGVK